MGKPQKSEGYKGRDRHYAMMASPPTLSSGAPHEKIKNRRYKKEHSLYIDVGDNKVVYASTIIEAISESCGESELFACVPKSGNLYMITMRDKDMRDLLLDGIKCKGKTYNTIPVVKDTVNVSIMGVDPCIEDFEIADAIENMDATVLGEVRRLVYPGTNVENGNRLCSVRLPKERNSLPYLLRVPNGNVFDSYRIIHDDQKKLCNKCYSPSHLFKDCPKFTCFKCQAQGHFKSQCMATWCHDCFSYQCKCCNTADIVSNVNDSEIEDEAINKVDSAEKDVDSAEKDKANDYGKSDDEIIDNIVEETADETVDENVDDNEEISKENSDCSTFCEKCKSDNDNCKCDDEIVVETDKDKAMPSDAVWGDFIVMSNEETTDGDLPESLIDNRNESTAQSYTTDPTVKFTSHEPLAESTADRDDNIEMLSPRKAKKRSNADDNKANRKIRLVDSLKKKRVI